ncbi:hypothetical protein Tco_1374832, partial [Tanacetum coccineum]
IDTILTDEATPDQVVHDKEFNKGTIYTFQNPEREFCSSRKLFKTLSLDESSSPELDLFSDLEEHSKEEVAETMAKTMEEYMSWERFKELLTKCPQHYLTDIQEVILFYNGLEVSTRQILDSKGAIPTKTDADAKVAIQEMTEYSQKWHNRTSKTRTIQAQLNNLGREIKKVNEKVYTAQVGCELCKGPHCTKDCPLKKKEKPLKKHIILNLVYLSNKEGNIEQQLWDSTKEIMQILCIKNEDNQWKNH